MALLREYDSAADREEPEDRWIGTIEGEHPGAEDYSPLFGSLVTMTFWHSSDDLVRHLGLIPHDEGGWYRQTIPDRHTRSKMDRETVKDSYSAIYYMLTAEQPIGYLHVNKSDIVHCFHAGSPLTYLLIGPDGCLVRRTLGPDCRAGHELQLLVKGGTWKATTLESGDFGLVSEIVIPAFEAQDREFATMDRIRRLFPFVWPEVAPYIRPQLSESDET